VTEPRHANVDANVNADSEEDQGVTASDQETGRGSVRTGFDPSSFAERIDAALTAVRSASPSSGVETSHALVARHALGATKDALTELRVALSNSTR